MIRVNDFIRKDQNIKRLITILIISATTIAILQPKIFLSKSYLKSMTFLFPEFGILALGMMLCMIIGGIDLSMVATANFSGILSSILLIRLLPEGSSSIYSIVVLILVIAFALLVGALCGTLNGFLIAKIGIPPILATLGVSDLVMGLAIALTKGSSVSGMPSILPTVINHTVFNIIPVPLILFIICAAIVSIMLSKKSYGLKLYLMGSNPTASTYSGVNNARITFITFISSGMLAAVSGIIMCGRFNSARADFGSSYTMQAILICVLGGVNSNGGFGQVKGVVLSILILQILSSGFNMFPSISNFYRDLIWGLVLIGVMAYNYISNNRKKTVKVSSS